MKYVLILIVISLAPLTTFAQELSLKTEIMMCESHGNVQALNPNDGGSPSYGLFQFKLGTFRGFAIEAKVLPEGTTLEEARKYIMRPEYNGAVAHYMLDKGLYSHWKNCYQRAIKV